MMNALFVCTENRLRSRTAEAVYMQNPEIFVRSAGTSSTAVKQVTQEDLEWADLVIVMEPCHRRVIKKHFPTLANNMRLICLNIPDIYEYMAPDLIVELRGKLKRILNATT